jgi:hypothetical protein
LKELYVSPKRNLFSLAVNGSHLIAKTAALRKPDGMEQNIYEPSEPHNFYVAPAPGRNFDVAPAAPAQAPAPTRLYSRRKFLNGVKVNIRSVFLFYSYSV